MNFPKSVRWPYTTTVISWRPHQTNCVSVCISSSLTSSVGVTSVFRSPVTPALQRCATGCWGATPVQPVHLLLYYVSAGGAGNVWLNMLSRIEWTRGAENRGDGLWPADFHGVERRYEAWGGGEQLLRRWRRRLWRRWGRGRWGWWWSSGLTDCDRFGHRVRDLLRWMWAVRGARVRAGLVLCHRAEDHLLSVRHRGLLPRTHCDPYGHQSYHSQGKRVEQPT